MGFASLSIFQIQRFLSFWKEACVQQWAGMMIMINKEKPRCKIQISFTFAYSLLQTDDIQHTRLATNLSWKLVLYRRRQNNSFNTRTYFIFCTIRAYHIEKVMKNSATLKTLRFIEKLFHFKQSFQETVKSLEVFTCVNALL